MLAHLHRFAIYNHGPSIHLHPVALLFFILFLGVCTSRIICDARYGTRVKPGRCLDALESLVMTADNHGESPLQFSPASYLPGGLLQMPQAFIGETCSIGIDFTYTQCHSGSPSYGTVFRPYEEFTRQIDALSKTCINRDGFGGISYWSGYEIMVVDPQASLIRNTIFGPTPPLKLSHSHFLETRQSERAQSHVWPSVKPDSSMAPAAEDTFRKMGNKCPRIDTPKGWRSLPQPVWMEDHQ